MNYEKKTLSIFSEKLKNKFRELKQKMHNFALYQNNHQIMIYSLDSQFMSIVKNLPMSMNIFVIDPELL